MKAGLHLVEGEQGPVAAAKLLRLFEIAIRRTAHAGFSLNGLQNEGRKAFRGELFLEVGEVAEGVDFVSGSSGPKPSFQKPFDINDSAPQVSPWKPFSA